MGLILLPGTCSGCGCTDAHACDGGCSWVDPEHTLCSGCLPEDDSDPADDGSSTFLDLSDPEIGGRP